ncbi:hypothetical protein [Acinetobacter sp. SWAC57]|uniref:hypothetical protein n=1 Tax=Acinetobacter sp. SWAC57 TaxID=2293834 RepID=UPI000E5AB233|nr:hypothetical protein [Acinetobacter sp. SWAC57]RGD93395.1 hypothetical protein DYI96_00730 [Acinetobacter sp. SWAC57]
MVFDKNFNLEPPDVYFELPELDELDLTLAEIRELSDDDLLKLLTGESYEGMIHPALMQVISHELTSRQVMEASRPHWTVTPTFIVGCIASLLAAISILVTIYFSVFYKAENNNKHTDQSYAIEKNRSPK